MTSFQSQHSRSSSPPVPEFAESPFCSTCEHNQALVQKLVAEYLPDDDDPEYERYEAAFHDYRAELEERYPQVCKACEMRVNEQIDSAAYTARSDHLRRVMERSIQKQQVVSTTRQSITLRIISLAKWFYILSLLVQMTWHVFGFMMAPDERVWEEGESPNPLAFSADTCLRQAIQEQSVDDCCVMSTTVTTYVTHAIVADMVTLWWNPRLKSKTNSITGRMQGLKRLWAIRIFVLLVRVGSLYYWSRTSVQADAIQFFHNTHISMLLVLALSALSTWKLVTITYHPPAFAKTNNAPTSPPDSAKKPSISSYRPAHPAAGSFDTMAQQFAYGFDDTNGSTAFPPSPTLTDISTSSTQATATPSALRTKYIDNNNDTDMDWTPEHPIPVSKFSLNPPPIFPTPWSHQTPPPPKPASHSIFAQPDPNPFHRKVPAAPRAPAQVASNPWKPSVWAPPLKQNAPNFFNADKDKGLAGEGVPRRVRRDAELFAGPKLKYDYYGYRGVRDTGLEEGFNGLFSK